jgi:hypothetical protein
MSAKPIKISQSGDIAPIDLRDQTNVIMLDGKKAPINALKEIIPQK